MKEVQHPIRLSPKLKQGPALHRDLILAAIICRFSQAAPASYLEVGTE